MAIDFVAASSEYVTAGTEFTALRNVGSMSFWITTTQVGNDTDWQAPAVSGREFPGQNDCMWGWIDNNGGLSRIGFSWNPLGASAIIKSTSRVNDGVQHHVVITVDATTGAMQLFFDGVLQASATGVAQVPTNTFSDIGRMFGGGNPYFDGILDDVRIYDRVLSAAEVTALHAQHGADGIIYGLVSRWRMDEASPGTVVSGAGVVKDDVGANAATPSATPEYTESDLQWRRAG